MTIIYATGNIGKFKTAENFLKPYGVDLIQQKVSVVEIQSDSITEISLHKAKETFAKI